MTDKIRAITFGEPEHGKFGSPEAMAARNVFYEIEVTDHRNLGGPMGSDESTPIIDQRFVKTVEEIVPVMVIMARKHRVSLELLPSRPVVGETYDFGHVGITVHKREFS